MVVTSCAPVAAQSRHERGELIDESLQEFPRAIVVDVAIIINEIRLERDVDVAALQDRAETKHNRPEMLLRQRRANRAARRAGDKGRLAGPAVFSIGARTPIDRVFQHRRYGAIVLWRDDEDAVGVGEFGFETDDFGRQVRFDVLVKHGQVIDAQERGVKLVGTELDQRLCQFAVDRSAAVAADNDGDMWSSHELRAPWVKADD
jgi:hypothetical protein